MIHLEQLLEPKKISLENEISENETKTMRYTLFGSFWRKIFSLVFLPIVLCSKSPIVVCL